MIGLKKDQKRFFYFLDLIRKRNNIRKLRLDNVFEKKFTEFEKLKLNEVFPHVEIFHFDGVWILDNRENIKKADEAEE